MIFDVFIVVLNYLETHFRYFWMNVSDIQGINNGTKTDWQKMTQNDHFEKNRSTL